ncbi:hypothetical protein SDC9_71505 [bioreactor metagenome]|uniref:Outer membrane protein beta-barrel domain-containing protein n=1 Tax=bioreactor metagenome TaxID=1076179 RepID=A0A644Y8W9_9ZZZZ
MSVDYEGADYSTVKMLSEDGDDRDFRATNNYISGNFRSAYTLRAGAEVRPIPGFALRAGYTKYGNPEKTLGYESEYISGGLGFSSSAGIFLDVAFQQRLKDTEYFSLYQDYTNHTAPVGSYETSGWKLLLTLGFRF